MNDMRKDLIAPCGMNCNLCIGYQREKNKCAGCRNLNFNNNDNSKKSTKCVIKDCSVMEESKLEYCFECHKIPCSRLKQLDKRYKTKYHMSMLENLEYIKEQGLDAFVENEEIRWKCSYCGSILCVHRKECVNCKEKAFD